jgi:hypothetical protein
MTALLMRTSGLRLVLNINFDLLFYALTIGVALGFGAWFGTVITSG